MSFNCDFNAPMFVDFDNVDVNDHNPESYFEIDHEAAFEAATATENDSGTDPLAEQELMDSAEPQTTPPSVGAESLTVGEESLAMGAGPLTVEAEPSKPKTSKIVSSWGSSNNAAAMKITQAKPNRSETPTRKALRKAVEETVATVTNSPKLQLPERGTRPKRLGTNLGGLPRFGSPAKNAPESGASAAAASLKPQSPAGVARWRKAFEKLTPEVLRAARNKLQSMKTSAVPSASANSEETGATAKTFRDQLRAKRKPLDAAQPSAGPSRLAVALPIKAAPLPVAKHIPPTDPKPFRFATDSRIRPKTSESDSKAVFSKMLRTYPNAPPTAVGGPTAVKPFNFSNHRTRARSVEPTPERSAAPSQASGGAAGKFISTAERIRKFQMGTPDRFRSQPRGRSSSVGVIHRRRSPSPQVARGQTPNLLTRGRSRPTNVLSREQLEEIEMEEARKNAFRARPINDGIKPMRPASVEKRPLTKPEPFNLTETHSRSTASSQPEEHSEFHAQPVPRRMFEGPVGIPERRQLSLVEPHSPAFTLNERLASRKRPAPTVESEPAEEDRIFRAKPAPHFGVPIVIKPNDSKKVTKVEPFSFANRDAGTIEKKQQKLHEAAEDEKKQREFKAKPAPNLHKPISLPIKEVILPTMPQPFDLQIERRVGERLQKWQEDVDKELEAQREAAKFHAKPATVLEKQPFIPKPADKPLLEVSNFELHSDRRAREREEYDMLRKQKEAELEAHKRQLEEQRRHDEEAELQRLRREAVHKAQPIRHYKPVETRPSSKPLTMPVSPKFSTLSRERKSSAATTASTNSSNTAGLNETFDV